MCGGSLCTVFHFKAKNINIIPCYDKKTQAYGLLIKEEELRDARKKATA
jgi:hypothetical protein